MSDPLERVAEALERMAPAPTQAPNFETADAFVWRVAPDALVPVQDVSRVDINLLVGISRSRDTLLQNTIQFAKGYSANNALLWGARGMGKSSLVKSVHAKIVKMFSLKSMSNFYSAALNTTPVLYTVGL